MGVVKSWKTAVSWLEKSALQQNANAQFRLAEYLSTGVVGVKKDERRALDLYRLTAAQQQSDGSARDLNLTNPEGYAFHRVLRTKRTGRLSLPRHARCRL